MSNNVENTNIQVENVTERITTKPTKQVQAFELYYNGKKCIFDINVIKEPIKQGEVSRSLRDYQVTTSEEYTDIFINDLQNIQNALGCHTSAPSDSVLFESVIGGVIRSVDFIYL